MAAITIPAGALAAAKSGAPMPSADAPKADVAPAPKAEPKKEAAPKPAPKPEPKATEPPPADATAAEKKAWKLKVGGKEVDYDASDEERIKRDIQKGLAADETFQTAAQQRKQAEQFFAMLKDPAQLKKLLADPRVGIDVKKFAEEQVWEAIQQEKREAEWAKNPEAKAKWEREQHLNAVEEREKAAKAEAETAAQRAETQKYEAHYEKTILAALEVGGLPATPEAAARMGHYLGVAMEQGLDLTPAELVEVVRSDYLREIASVFGAATGEQILALLGEDGAKKLREADLGRLKTSTSKPFPKRSDAKQAADAKGAPASAPKKLGGAEWKAELLKEFANRK